MLRELEEFTFHYGRIKRLRCYTVKMVNLHLHSTMVGLKEV